MREYYLSNKEKMNRQSAVYRTNNYERDIFHRCKRSAQVYGYPFDLLLEDIQIPEKCPFLNIPLTRTQGHGRVWTNASIDRIVPSLGYVKGNIQIISDLANRMKQEATKEQLLIFAKNVERVYGPA